MTECESPLDIKARNKALTKPKTISNYFAQVSNTANKEDFTDVVITSTLKENQPKASTIQTRSVPGKTINNSKQVKRTCSSQNSSNILKKRKQSNIFDMIIEQKNKKKTCPVCQKVLDGMSNELINKHVDSCLIE